MAQALDNGSCVGNIKGLLTVPILTEHLFIWDLVDGLNLQQGIEDQYRWRLSRSGTYFRKSAYNAFFLRTIYFAPRKRSREFGKLRLLYIASSLYGLPLITAAGLHITSLSEGCHTTVPHRCLPHCGQSQESIQHIVPCVFAWQVWSLIFQRPGLFSISPQPNASYFSSWWCRVIK